MQIIRNNKIFFVTLLVIGIIITGQTIYAFLLSKKNQELSDLMEKKLQNRNYLATIIPSPDNQNLQAVKLNFENINKQLEEYTADLTINAIKKTALENNISESEELYFNIIEFIEAHKIRAKSNNIILINGDDENFGFDKFVNTGTGPRKENIEGVYKQRLILEYILKNLFLSKPKSIIAIEREEINSSNEKNQLSGKNSPDDIFQIDKRITDKVPGVIETTGFKLIFTSRTQSLRNFLKLLANFDYPLVVQSVEVESHQDKDNKTLPSNSYNIDNFLGLNKQNPDAKDQIPVVSNNLSKFTVTIEYIELR